MRYIKKYENSDDLQIGDLIMASDAETLDPKIKDFVENEIGVLYEINEPFYLVKYEGFPKGWENISTYKKMVAPFYRTEIRKATDEEIKEWEFRKKAEKYNL